MTYPPNAELSFQQRVVRVFASSAFSDDIRCERDVLVKKTFPR
jgi:hypothetical protein